MIDNNVYIRYRMQKNDNYLTTQTLIFPKDTERVIHGDINLKAVINLENFYKYPQIGDVYIKPIQDDGIETIMNFNLFLYRRIMLLSLDDLGMNWKCIVNDKQGPFRLMTIGKDTFKNLFLNLDEFIYKHYVKLLTDIKVKISFEGYIEGLFMKYLGKDGKSKKLLIRETWRD